MRRRRLGAGMVLAGITVTALASVVGPVDQVQAAEGTVNITSTAIDKTVTWAGDTVVVSFSYSCNGAAGDSCTAVSATIPGVFGTDVFGQPFGALPAVGATTTPHVTGWTQDLSGSGDVTLSFIDPLPAGATGNVTVTYQTFGTSVPDGTVHTFIPQITSSANTVSGAPRSVELEADWSWRAYHGWHAGSTYFDTDYSMGANWCPNNWTGPISGSLYLPGSYLELVIKSPDVVVVDAGDRPGLTATVISNPTETIIRWEPTAFFQNCTGTGYVVRFPASAFSGGETIEFELNAFGPGGSPDPAANTNGPQLTSVTVVPPPPPTLGGYKGASGTFLQGSEVEWSLNVVVGGGLPADEVTVVDAIPTGQELVRFNTGIANTPGWVSVEYSTSGASGPWSSVPGSPFDRMSPQDVDASVLPDPSAVTHIRWNFGTVAPFSIPGSRLVTRIPADAAVGTLITNCERVFAEFQGTPIWGGEPGPVSDYCRSITVEEATPRPFVQADVAPVVWAGSTEAVVIRGLNSGTGAFVAPRYSVILPPGFTYVPGSARPGGGSAPPSSVPEPTVSTHPDFPGQQWLTFDPLVDAIPPQSSFLPATQELVIDVEVPPFDYTLTPQIRVWLGAMDPGAATPVVTCDAMQTVTDVSDHDGDGQEDDLVCASWITVSTPRNVAADATHDGTDGSEPWSTLVEVEPGAAVQMRALLRSRSTTRLGPSDLIWTLPALGDRLPSADAPRGSEFTTVLAAPVDVDVAAQLDYSTSPNPCRGEVGGPDLAGVDCDAPNWQPWGVHPASSVRSVRVRVLDGVPIGAAVEATATVTVPDEATLVDLMGPSGTASSWSSYAFRATVLDTGDVLDGESERVELRVSWNRADVTTTTAPPGSSTTTVPEGPTTTAPDGGPSTTAPGGDPADPGDPIDDPTSPTTSTVPTPSPTTSPLPDQPGPGDQTTVTPDRGVDRLPVTGAASARLATLGAFLVALGLVTMAFARPRRSC